MQHSTLALARLLIAHPHLRATLVIDKALQALLLSTQHCSQLTELCTILKNNNSKVEPGAGDFDKIATALETSCRTVNRIAQFVITNNVSDECSDISGVSIHTLNDAVVDDVSIRNLSCASTTTLGKSNNTLIFSEESDFDTESDGKDSPCNNFQIPKESRSFFSPILLSIKFMFLLLINILSICLIIQLLFTTTVYILTGKLFLEFKVEKAPETWLEKATVAAFGSEEEIIQIRNVFELFATQNLVKLLKYLINCFDHKL